MKTIWNFIKKLFLGKQSEENKATNENNKIREIPRNALKNNIEAPYIFRVINNTDQEKKDVVVFDTSDIYFKTVMDNVSIPITGICYADAIMDLFKTEPIIKVIKIHDKNNVEFSYDLRFENTDGRGTGVWSTITLKPHISQYIQNTASEKTFIKINYLSKLTLNKIPANTILDILLYQKENKF